MEKPLILVSNDDGITSRGIKMLVECMKEIGEVIVVAPDSPQSGMGHAITIGNTLRLDSTEIFDGVTSYECSGTPADCVKIAIDKILRTVDARWTPPSILTQSAPPSFTILPALVSACSGLTW